MVIENFTPAGGLAAVSLGAVLIQASRAEQVVQVVAGLVLKPCYMTLSLFLAILLWRRRDRVLTRIRLGLLADLPGLRDLRWDPADVAVLGRAIETAACATSSRVVLVGFSHGASLALLAAARPAWSSLVAHVLAFGAYHSLGRVFAGLAGRTEPARAADWDDFIYAHLVQVHRQGEALGLAPPLRAAADDLLRRYCDAAPLEEKRRFFEAQLRPLGLLRHDHARQDPATLAAVSPAGQLGGLTCSVGLLHDPDDVLVPVSEARALLEELERTCSARCARHRLLVTRLVRHVTPSGALHPGEAIRLVGMMSTLVGG